MVILMNNYNEKINQIKWLRAIGIEKSADTLLVAHQNIRDFPNIQLIHADSQTFTSFVPCTICFAYDGPQPIDRLEYHVDIILTVLRSQSIRAMFSTKVSENVFLDYTDGQQEDHYYIDSLTGRKWQCIRIQGLAFDTSRYMGFLWILNSDDHTTNLRTHIDSRLAKCYQ